VLISVVITAVMVPAYHRYGSRNTAVPDWQPLGIGSRDRQAASGIPQYLCGKVNASGFSHVAKPGWHARRRRSRSPGNAAVLAGKITQGPADAKGVTITRVPGLRFARRGPSAHTGSAISSWAVIDMLAFH
jgi:hypothetical protein